jgi:hypothetical protein
MGKLSPNRSSLHRADYFAIIVFPFFPRYFNYLFAKFQRKMLFYHSVSLVAEIIAQTPSQIYTLY